MNREVGARERMILETLWDIVTGDYPRIEGLTEAESKALFLGEPLAGIVNPFLPLAADMEVETLPPMVLQTTDDVQLRDRQMSVHHMYNNINHMLELMVRVVEQLEIEEIADNVF
jgi:hypothetical protein